MLPLATIRNAAFQVELHDRPAMRAEAERLSARRFQVGHHVVARDIPLMHVVHREHRNRTDDADKQDIPANQPRLVAAVGQQ